MNQSTKIAQGLQYSFHEVPLQPRDKVKERVDKVAVRQLCACHSLKKFFVRLTVLCRSAFCCGKLGVSKYDKSRMVAHAAENNRPTTVTCSRKMDPFCIIINIVKSIAKC